MTHAKPSLGIFTIKVQDELYIKGEVQTLQDGIKKPVLIISHGFRGHKDWGFWPSIAERFASNGFYTIRYDFSRISANRDGLDEQVIASASTVSQELADLSKLVSNLLNLELPFVHEADVSQIALLGHSRSGGSSIIYASEHEEIGAVAVWNGGRFPNHAEKVKEGTASLIERAVHEDLSANEERYDVIRAFAALKIAALLVQGDQDNEGLLAQNKKLREAAPSQHFASIAGGDHTFGILEEYENSTVQLEQAWNETLRFLKSVIS